MTINRIQNATLRRTALVVLVVPAFVLTFLWESAKLLRELGDEFPDVVRHCWRGE